jgi:hypothetical protein
MVRWKDCWLLLGPLLPCAARTLGAAAEALAGRCVARPVCVYVCMYVSVCVYVCMYVCVHVCACKGLFTARSLKHICKHLCQRGLTESQNGQVFICSLTYTPQKLQAPNST